MQVKDKIIKYLHEQIGKPYKLGTRGPDKFDCSGLTKRAAEFAGYTWYHGATTQWKEGFTKGYWEDTGTIDTLPTNKLAFLFNQDTTKKNLVMAHTGVYLGDGYVIQAGGYGGSGVHKGFIDKRRWSHWATLKGVDSDMATSGIDGIKRGDTGAKVKYVQAILVHKGYALRPTKNDRESGIDGKFGADTENVLKQYQKDKGLKPTGVWGEAEEAALNASGEIDVPQPEAMVSVPARLLEELMTYIHG